jgi:diacylglycerol kinase family enzyme
MDLLDPTIPRPEQRIEYAKRPPNLRALRIGLIDSTKKNAEPLLRRIAAKLEAAYGMTCEVVVHKHQRSPLEKSQIAELQGKTDFVIVGVGD